MANILKNPKFLKSLYVSTILIVANALGLVLISTANVPLGAGTFAAAAFLPNLIVIGIAALAYDYIRKKPLQWVDAIALGLGGAIALTSIVAIFGVTSYSANFPVNLIIADIVVLVTGWLFIEVGDKIM